MHEKKDKGLINKIRAEKEEDKETEREREREGGE